jgi:2-C-methyl-D-erythritol 4-phosphate cytidylyltransferase
MGKGRPKQFLEVSEKPILLHTVEVLARVSFISSIFLVVPKDYLAEAESLLGGLGCCCGCGCSDETSEGAHGAAAPGSPEFIETGSQPDERAYARPSVTIVPGGVERQDSVFNGLRHLPAECEWVLIHDGVRPFVSMKLLEETWLAAHETGASIAALPATDTVKRVVDGKVVETVPREEMWLVQTPQVFRKDLLLNAYLSAREHGWSGTDDASFLERSGIPVKVVRGERSNIKVTTPEDLAWASWFLARGRDLEIEG